LPGPSAVSGSSATNVVSGSSAVQVTASGPSAVHLTTSGPRAAYSTPLGPSAEYLTTSGPCATHFTTLGPCAAQPTSPGPSADPTITSTDLDDRARFPPSSSTSHHRRTPTSPTPSDSEINPSAFLAQLYPSVSGCDHDVAQADDVDLGPAPKDVVDVKDSRPPFGTINGQPPGKRNRRLTRAEKDKWKIEEALRRGEQTSEADIRAIHNAIQKGMAAYYGQPYKVRSSLIPKKK